MRSFRQKHLNEIFIELRDECLLSGYSNYPVFELLILYANEEFLGEDFCLALHDEMKRAKGLLITAREKNE